MKKRYELGMAKGYVSEWTVQDALREFVQNGIDQEKTVKDNRFAVSFNEGKQELLLCNRSSVLNRSTLLLGCSSKRDDDKTVGKFGEGYKLAVLVLLREGRGVEIDNYGAKEKWVFRFSKLKKYDYEESLVVDVDTAFPWAKVPDDDLTVRITGITEDDYEGLKERTLSLRTDGYGYRESSFGKILLDGGLAGKIFVNGLFVTDVDSLTYGYDILPEYLEIGRDRNLVNDYNILGTTKRMLIEAFSTEEIMRLVNEGARDVGQMENTFDSPDLYMDKTFSSGRRDLADSLYAGLEKKYGRGVLVAKDEDQRKEYERKNPSRACIVDSSQTGSLVRAYSDAYHETEAEAGQEEVDEKDMCLSDRVMQWLYDNGCSGDPTELLDILSPMVDAYEKAGGDFYGDRGAETETEIAVAKEDGKAYVIALKHGAGVNASAAFRNACADFMAENGQTWMDWEQAASLPDRFCAPHGVRITDVSVVESHGADEEVLNPGIRTTGAMRNAA